MRVLRVLVVVLSLSAALLAADNPFSGTWNFNSSKSHQIPPDVKSSTAHVEADQQSFKLTQDFVDDKGQSMTVSFEAKSDGKQYPVKGDPDTESVSMHRVNQREAVFTYRKGDKVTSKVKVIVSLDGKTTTLHVTDYSGAKPKTGTYVYDKQ
jgi:hypothetical protein